MTLQNREYRDLNLSFSPHPITGDVTVLSGQDALKRAIKNLILTNFFEVPFQPAKGSGVRHFLFEPMDTVTQVKLQSAIRDVLRVFEPRIDVQAVNLHANYEANGYDVQIVYAPLNTLEPVTISLFLERLR